MAIPKLLQGLVNTAQTSKTVVQKNTQKKADKALGGLITTANKVTPQARASELLPGLVKTAETTGKIGQANVAKKQEQAKELLGDMTQEVDRGFTQARTTSLADFLATTEAKPELTPADIKSKFPEFKGKEQALADFLATMEAKPNMTQEEIQQKFPEFYTVEKQKKGVFSVASDVLGGAYRSVVDIPQTIVETGILDKPAEFVAKGPIGEAIRSGAKSLFGEKAVADYQAKEGNKPFSEVSKGMTVGDTSSPIYQGTRAGADILQLGTTGVQIAKGVAKKGLKKSLLGIMKESDTIGNKRAALARGGIETQGKLSKWWSGSKDIVKPSQRTLDAVEEVANTVKGASKNPQKLFSQVTSKISSIGDSLQGKLKTIDIKGNTIPKVDLNKKLSDLATEIRDISPTMGNKLKVLSKNITKAENADDFRKALQQLDDLVPDSVKKGINLSGKDQYIYDAWRAARSEGNDVLSKIAEGIPDAAVKKSFKSMSNLYHAKGQISENIGRLTKKEVGMKTKLARLAKNAALIGGGGYVAGKVGLGSTGGGGSSYTAE